MNVHEFATTREAYNASQTHEEIRDGDVLVARQDLVTGVLVGAWPTVVFSPDGGDWEFHGLNPDLRWGTYDNGRYAESAVAAFRAAVERGWA